MVDSVGVAVVGLVVDGGSIGVCVGDRHLVYESVCEVYL